MVLCMGKAVVSWLYRNSGSYFMVLNIYRYYDIICVLKGVYHMPYIRPSSDLRNKYSEISNFCHENAEPVYVTKNGKGDLAVLSIETYERLVGKFELRKLLEEGMQEMREGNVFPVEDVFRNIGGGKDK